jgi:rhomboid protease GluP
MEKFLIKVRHIVPTLIYISLGSLATICLVRWSIFQFGWFELKEDIWRIWLPLIFPWIPITIWLRPKLRILIRKKEADRLQLGYQFLAWFVIGIPLFISQMYLNTAMGEMEEVTDLKAIQLSKRTRFVTIKKFEVLLEHGSSAEDIRTSGKHNQHLDINLYFVAPIVHSVSDPRFAYWYGVKFHKQISSRLSSTEKENQYKAFYRECIDKMNTYPFYELEYFTVAEKSDDKTAFLKAIERKMQMKIAPVILLPETEKFDGRNGNKLFWIFGSLGIGLIVFTLFLALPRYSTLELERQRKGVKPKSDEVVDMLMYLIPKEPHVATSVILNINILVCLAMIFSGVHIMSPNGVELMEWGANRRVEAMGGEWWRLITSMFVHGGIVHLLFNMFGLYLGSTFLEILYGAKRYALVYLLSGLTASIASIVWHANTASIGASGAIFGVFGAIASFLITDHFTKEGKRALLIMFGPYVGINLLIGFAGWGIDNAGHLGGMAGGFVVGFILNQTLPKKANDEN